VSEPSIALLDYGIGNLVSVGKALAHVGFRVVRAQEAREIEGCDAVLLPGVGHFTAMKALRRSFGEAIERAVGRGTPLLGVCLGLQFLFDGSDEAPDVSGLGLLSGMCFRLNGDTVKVPHVGWNVVGPVRASALLRGMEGAFVYFTHSYAAPVTAATIATTTHGIPFASVVESGHVFGVQWHPEKSGEPGLVLLRNFAEIVSTC
jgi:glutamine amidotransferase